MLECSSKSLAYMLPFFCGQGPDCKQPTVETFLKAKFNLETKYLGMFSSNSSFNGRVYKVVHLEIIGILVIYQYNIILFEQTKWRYFMERIAKLQYIY